MSEQAREADTEYEVVDRFDGGVGWIAHPEEAMRRTSHALFDDGDVWLVDPVDASDLDRLWRNRGDVAGVVVLLDRHTRDADTIAARHDVAVWLPEAMADVASDLSSPVELFDSELAGTGYRTHPLTTNRFWTEVALYDDESGTLVVPEALGTNASFRAPGERLGVHPVLRLRPPRSLAGYDPQRILVGHGEGIHEHATAALRGAVRGSRRRAPSLYWSVARSALPV